MPHIKTNVWQSLIVIPVHVMQYFKLLIIFNVSMFEMSCVTRNVEESQMFSGDSIKQL